jgi:drug/metabolite transporter (DMT)-like permease
VRSLLAATLVWALSFGLIKRHLGGLDPNLVAAVRLLLALPLFVPLLRWRGLSVGLVLRLLVIGAVEYGVMYIFYIAAYGHAAGHEIALYTVLTPLYVVLLHDLAARRLVARNLGLAALAALGAAVIQYKSGARVLWTGFLLVQIANLCFSWGQVEYRRLRRERADLRDRDVFALLYAGGVLVTLPAALLSGGFSQASALTSAQWLVLVYLGVVASGLGFYLWNRGAVQVGPGSLAVANNLKVPLGVLAALTIFGETADGWPLLLGGGMMVVAAVLAGRGREA